jgi:hypothetical protein
MAVLHAVHLRGTRPASKLVWRDPMTVDMNKHVPAKRPETEPPTEVHDTDNPQEKEHKKMADRAAHKAAKDQQTSEQDHNTFTI